MKPFRRVTGVLVLVAVVIAEPACAETSDPADAVATYRMQENRVIDKWSKKKGVVVANEVREELTQLRYGYGGPRPSTGAS